MKKKCCKQSKYKLFTNNNKLCYKRILAMTEYDGTFTGNILVVGQTSCGKTTFAQNHGKNRTFGELKSVDWVSKITQS